MDYKCGNGHSLKIVCPNLHVDTSNLGQVLEFQPIGKKLNSTTKKNLLQNRAKYCELLLIRMHKCV